MNDKWNNVCAAHRQAHATLYYFAVSFKKFCWSTLLINLYLQNVGDTKRSGFAYTKYIFIFLSSHMWVFKDFKFTVAIWSCISNNDEIICCRPIFPSRTSREAGKNTQVGTGNLARQPGLPSWERTQKEIGALRWIQRFAIFFHLKYLLLLACGQRPKKLSRKWQLIEQSIW